MRHRKFRVSHRRRRHNPFFGRSRRHRNPVDSGTMATAAWAIAGGVGATWLPGVAVPQMTGGWGDVLATGVSAVVISWVGKKFVGERAGEGLLIGGLVATGGKLIAKALGKNLVSFGMGQYTNTFFGPPYNSTGLLQNTASPYVPPAVASGTQSTMKGLMGRSSKFGSRFSR